MKITQQILPAVAAAIFNENGEVLLQKRKDVNKWCVISGHVEFGETIEKAILREIREETNAEASIVRFIGVYSSPQTQTYTYPTTTIQYVTSYFEVKLTSPISNQFSDKETHELKFFSRTNIPRDMAMINPHWLSDALDRNKNAFIR